MPNRITSERASELGRAGGVTKKYNAVEKRIKELVAAAPPLDDERRRRLAALLLSSDAA